MFTVKLSPNLVTPVVVKLLVVTSVNVTLAAVETLMPPASAVSSMLSPVVKFAVLSVLLRVLTLTPSICVTTVWRALSALLMLALVSALKSTT